jgi:hypothetical protein
MGWRMSDIRIRRPSDKQTSSVAAILIHALPNSIPEVVASH